MKKLKNTLIIIPFFTLSCASAQYVESYDPINVFLETQKLEKGKEYILQREKINNTEALRLFNGGEGAEHIIDSTDPIDYTDGLFVEKHWKKMYKQYAQDTISKYWKKQDFPAYNFILEDKNGLLKLDFMNRYLNSRIETIVMLSEPMYYMDKKYIMFYFNKVSFFGDTKPQLVIMKKEKGIWSIVRIMGDYIYY
ncbi:hypothetical protein [Flavobacterium pectinovorum]|jgi:hypothetical protein|uniref:Uncharacterized protein n=1 Tax=Flavobacterium pectinovorum TaxID=29533 RepID=A0A502F2U6_9FLAO|nr:hypothetical protein [Flavobacterium pectinovorum]TPG44343.1 hypothetical protein EAH81_02395 [Flavobacterium pectinovorum]